MCGALAIRVPYEGSDFSYLSLSFESTLVALCVNGALYILDIYETIQ
jgi:hypothetical protein